LRHEINDEFEGISQGRTSKGEKERDFKDFSIK